MRSAPKAGRVSLWPEKETGSAPGLNRLAPALPQREEQVGDELLLGLEVVDADALPGCLGSSQDVTETEEAQAHECEHDGHVAVVGFELHVVSAQ